MKIINNNFENAIEELKKNNLELKEVSLKYILDVFEKLYNIWKDKESDYYKKALEKLPDIVDFPNAMIKDGLEVISEIVKPDNILFNIKKSIGNPYILDNFKYSFDNQVYTLFRPLGVVAHISASNVFISCVDSVISGLCTKNSNILKMPRVDRFFPLLFLQSLQECDYENRLIPNIQLWDFRGGDIEVENVLKNNCDGIVVWGGEEAVMSYRNGLSLHTKLIEYGPKYSFSVIFNDNRIDEIAKNCAKDVIMWEQAACSSPHIIFVKDEFKEKFAQILYKELEKLEEIYPSPKLSLDEHTEILKFRELSEMECITENASMYKVENSSATVVLKDNTNFETSCQHRNIIIKSFTDEEQVLINVKELGKYIQTVSLWTERSHLLDFSRKLANYGVYKITTPGFMYQGKNGVPHDGSFPLRELGEFVHIENVSIDRFYEVVDFAKDNTEFYKGWDDDRLLTREDCFKNSPPFSTAMISDDDLNGFIFSSGGTTGKPKYAIYSPEDFDIMTDILADIYRAGGIKEGDRVANTFIAGNLWTSFLVANEALKKIGCTNFPIAGNSDFELIDSYLEKFNINAIVGLPSIIIKMAEICERKGLDVNIDTILYGGEHFYKGAREYVTKVWDVDRIASAGYAAVDTGPVGYQCKFLSGGVHHVCDDFVRVELVDDNGNFITEAGVAGEIVVTNINRYKMPIIRFKTGDLGRFVELECQCGFKGVTFELLGRCDDVVIAGSTNIELGSIDAAVSEFDELSSIWQVVVDTVDAKDCVSVFVEFKMGNSGVVTSDEVLGAIYRHARNVQKTVDQGWLDFRVIVVGSGEIERVERTGKVKKVVDKRK